jgi:hypothetical protein
MKDNLPNTNPSTARDLSHIFTDSLWQRLSRYRYYGEIDGVKIAVVLATKNPSFDNWALNKPDYDRAIAGKHDGRVDEAYVVAAKVNGAGVPQYCDQIDAEELRLKLANEVPRVGRFGEFFVIGPNVWSPSCDDEPF